MKQNIKNFENNETSGGEISEGILNHKILHSKRMNINRSLILLPLLKLLESEVGKMLTVRLLLPRPPDKIFHKFN